MGERARECCRVRVSFFRHIGSIAAFVLPLIASPAAAQRVGTGPFSRLFAHHLDSLQHDTLIQRLSSRPQGFLLNDLLPNDMLLRLSDSDLVDLAGVVAQSLEQVDTVTCARYSPGGADFDVDFMALAGRVDSITAERWIHVVHQMMRTGIYNLPRGPTVPLDSAILEGVRMMLASPPSERAQFRALVTAPVPSKSGRCKFAKYAWGSYSRMPASRVGPVLRALMATDIQ